MLKIIKRISTVDNPLQTLSYYIDLWDRRFIS